MKDIYHSDEISVVVDNNVLVDLYEIDCLHLLFSVFDHIVIPQVIFSDELPEAIRTLLDTYTYKLGFIETELGLETYGLLVNDSEFRKLSKYDCFAISIARENYYYCNSNDKPVRNACMKLNVKYTGVLGVLGRAYIKDKITKVELVKLLDLLSTDATSCYIDLHLIKLFKEEILLEKEESSS